MAKAKEAPALSHFERAQDAFDSAEGETRVSERMDVCPECGESMRCIKSYREPEFYRFEGICSAHPEHNIERFGYYSTEGTD